MSLSFKKETVYVLTSTDLDGVNGAASLSSVFHPTATAKPQGGAAKPTATAVSSAKPDQGGFAHPTATAKPAHHHGSLSSYLPRWLGGG